MTLFSCATPYVYESPDFIKEMRAESRKFKEDGDRAFKETIAQMDADEVMFREKQAWRYNEVHRVVAKYPETAKLAKADFYKFAYILQILKEKGLRFEDVVALPEPRRNPRMRSLMKTYKVELKGDRV